MRRETPGLVIRGNGGEIVAVALKWREYPSADSVDDLDWIEAEATVAADGIDWRYPLHLRSSDLHSFLQSIREWQAGGSRAATFAPLEPSIRLDIVWSADRTEVQVHVLVRRVLSGPEPAVSLQFGAAIAVAADLEKQLVAALEAYPPPSEEGRI
jgi:hypothetical protein